MFGNRLNNRYIGETVRSIYDIMDITVKENIPSLMLLIDFQKAFDSVEWKFLLKCLKTFQLPSRFLSLGQGLLENYMLSCDINNFIYI